MPRRHRIENLHHGAAVVSAEGKELGKLHAVVLDPRDNEITHIVVNAGPHFPEPGFGSPRLISVDIGQVQDAGEQEVVLKTGAEQFQKMPDYLEQEFFPAPAAETPAEPGGPVQAFWNAGLAIASSLSTLFTGIAVPAEHFRRARFERHILNDAPVWRPEPHTHIGDVERVLANEDTDEIAALVIRRGVLFGEDVVLPIGYVTEIQDGLIHVRISDDELRTLEPFREEAR